METTRILKSLLRHMRLHNLYLLAAVLLLSGCTQRRNKATAQRATQEDVRTRGQKKVQEKSADTLSLAQTENTLSASECGTGELPDSLLPVHVYTFNYADPSFPCSGDPKWGHDKRVRHKRRGTYLLGNTT